LAYIEGEDREKGETETPITEKAWSLVSKWHLASGNTYRNMQYDWRVPHNTISVVVREVVKAIIEEYTREILFCPTTAACSVMTFLEADTFPSPAFLFFCPRIWDNLSI
jgi:hypothetical protein